MAEYTGNHRQWAGYMRKVIVQLKLSPSEASLAGVRRKLALRAAQVDSDYGVRPTRPADGLYAVRVDADVAERLHVERHGPRPSNGPDDVRVALVH